MRSVRDLVFWRRVKHLETQMPLFYRRYHLHRRQAASTISSSAISSPDPAPSLLMPPRQNPHLGLRLAPPRILQPLCAPTLLPQSPSCALQVKGPPLRPREEAIGPTRTRTRVRSQRAASVARSKGQFSLKSEKDSYSPIWELLKICLHRPRGLSFPTRAPLKSIFGKSKHPSAEKTKSRAWVR